MKGNREEYWFNIINYIFVTFAFLIVLYPLIFVVSASISSPDLVLRGEVLLLPKGITFEGFRRVFRYHDIWIGYRNTIFYTISAIILSLFVTLSAAYALSRKDLKGRNIFVVFFTITMFFSGGLVPAYMLMKGLGLRNTVFAQIIPGLASFYNIVVSRTYFQTSIPDELQESALIDGCSNIKLFIRIVLPLSKPIIAVIALFVGVGQWNSFYNALVYISNRDIFPLQMFLREILIAGQFELEMLMEEGQLLVAQKQLETAELLKYAIIIVSSLPVIVVYPFLQKYFVKGIMIGALKG